MVWYRFDIFLIIENGFLWGGGWWWCWGVMNAVLILPFLDVGDLPSVFSCVPFVVVLGPAIHTMYFLWDVSGLLCSCIELLSWDCVLYILSCGSFLFPFLPWVCGFLLRCSLIRVDYSTPGFYFLRCDVASALMKTNRTIRELGRQKSKSQLPNAE
jgi:hypothetical protein